MGAWPRGTVTVMSRPPARQRPSPPDQRRDSHGKHPAVGARNPSHHRRRHPQRPARRCRCERTRGSASARPMSLPRPPATSSWTSGRPSSATSRRSGSRAPARSAPASPAACAAAVTELSRSTDPTGRPGDEWARATRSTRSPPPEPCWPAWPPPSRSRRRPGRDDPHAQTGQGLRHQSPRVSDPPDQIPRCHRAGAAARCARPTRPSGTASALRRPPPRTADHPDRRRSCGQAGAGRRQFPRSRDAMGRSLTWPARRCDAVGPPEARGPTCPQSGAPFPPTWSP